MDWSQNLWSKGLLLLLFVASGYDCAGNKTKSSKSGKKIKESTTTASYQDENSNKQSNLMETAPSFTFFGRDEHGKICILAKFEAIFTITYEATSGSQQLIAKIPRDTETRAHCVSLLDTNPYLDISWRGGFTFRMVFSKHESTNSWGVKGMNLVYNTKDSAFTESVDGRELIVRSDQDSLNQFETLLGKSYYCPSPSIINMYNPAGERIVILRLSNVQLQAYEIKTGKFSPMSRCGLVGFGSGVIAPFYLVSYHEDDSASMIVAVITILVSVLTVAGYAVYRAWFIKKVDYDTMI
ncbi:lysosome-associated membrane glycoprotein 5 [Tetranychus urticae]|uniref:Lysosome-associated membrane glycoprotein 5 n=1 Tax=Tetranychus urticae TaxID=32264 RepID=T1K2F9_TETUR|nr:lysosome-associated membrane glycoprotein 5 [Tetranychus urticae]